MIKGVVIDQSEYELLVKDAARSKIVISILGTDRNWILFGNDSRYNYNIESEGDKENITKVKEIINDICKEELTILNEKIKEYTLLKAEVQILTKLRDDTGKNTG